jgi:hypothetical protein
MKNQIRCGCVGVFIMFLANFSSAELPICSWGNNSNGICFGVCLKQDDLPVSENDTYFDFSVRSTFTNRQYICVPPIEKRYELKLLGPDGLIIHQLKPPFNSQKQAWFVSEFSVENTNASCSLDWFLLKDTFAVRTNGIHTLIASIRISAFTNFAVGKSKMQSKPTYILLPSVTNTFTIYPHQLKKHFLGSEP